MGKELKLQTARRHFRRENHKRFALIDERRATLAPRNFLGLLTSNDVDFSSFVVCSYSDQPTLTTDHEPRTKAEAASLPNGPPFFSMISETAMAVSQIIGENGLPNSHPGGLRNGKW